MTSPRVLLNDWNLKAKKSLGQNFLSDPNISRKIVEKCNFQESDRIVEIGSGLGALTIPAAKKTRKIFSVETDPNMIKLLAAELLKNGITNVEFIQKSILKVNLRDFYEITGQKIIILSNLPYNISSQVLIKLIKERPVVDRAILMFQREFAMRLLAMPDTKAYGRITAMLNFCATVTPLCHVQASMFFPKPKIDSTVLEICFKSKSFDYDVDDKILFRVIKNAFGQRRKTLKNALSGSDFQLPSDSIIDVLNTAEIDPSRRAETLTVHEFVKLSHFMKNHISPDKRD